MPVYEYKALTEAGNNEGGVIDADTPREARDTLRGRGLHIVEMHVTEKGKKRADGFKFRLPMPKFGGTKRLTDLALITRQMATLLGAGLTVTDSLGAIIEQLEDPLFEASFRGVRERITQGASLGEALEEYPEVFSEMYANMVKAGEASGSLEIVLNRLAQYTQQQARLQGRIGAALAYPLVMMFIGVAVVLFLLTFVVPRIISVLQQQGKLLPLPTQILIATSNFVSSYWYLLIGGAFGLFMLYQSIRATENGAFAIDRLKLRLPILGDLFRKHAISRFAKTFATLLASGLQVTESLRITRRVMDNRVLARVLDVVHDKIMEGADIATPLKNSGVFPATVGYMIAIGEQTGQLEELLEKIAESYDEEIELQTQKVLSLLEPLMIVCLAVVVGFIVLSIVLPILKISQG